jgi:hypothetical protein
MVLHIQGKELLTVVGIECSEGSETDLITNPQGRTKKTVWWKREISPVSWNSGGKGIWKLHGPGGVQARPSGYHCV